MKVSVEYMWADEIVSCDEFYVGDNLTSFIRYKDDCEERFLWIATSDIRRIEVLEEEAESAPEVL
jgi:hypothetical protein